MCPVCGAPFNRIDNNCPYCGVLVVIKSDHHRIDATQLNRTVINERIHEYRQALKNDRDDATAHYGLGVAYFNLGLLDESIEELSQASRIMPENPHIQTQLGVVLNELGHQRDPEFTNQAWKRLERALMLDPDNEDALVLREDLIKQRLRMPDLSPVDHSVARQQLFETWRSLARVDEARARPLISMFLNQNEVILQSLPQWKTHVRTAPKADANRWVLRTVGMAAGAFVLLCIAFGAVSSTLPEDANGSTQFDGSAGAFAILLVCSLFLIPPAIFVVGYAQRKRMKPVSSPATQARGGQPDSVSVLSDRAPISSMLQAAADILEAVSRQEAAANRNASSHR
jgi:uncharacterized Zn finger protein (UPF0148 family)